MESTDGNTTRTPARHDGLLHELKGVGKKVMFHISLIVQFLLSFPPILSFEDAILHGVLREDIAAIHRLW